MHIKGAGSHNVTKLLLKQQFCSIFDRPYHNDFPPLFFQNESVIFEGGFLYFERNSHNTHILYIAAILVDI